MPTIVAASDAAKLRPRSPKRTFPRGRTSAKGIALEYTVFFLLPSVVCPGHAAIDTPPVGRTTSDKVTALTMR